MTNTAHQGRRIEYAVRDHLIEHGYLDSDSGIPVREMFGLIAAALTAVARGDHGRAPATALVLSGDVHHAYVAEAHHPGRPLRSRLLQLTCSPVHNGVPGYMRLAFRAAWTRPASSSR